MSVITVSNQAVVDEAVRQFKERCESVSSQREMALLEQELWQQVRAHISASGSSAGRKQRWWDVALGGRNLASFRSAILMRGEPAQILWQYIDDKRITLRSAFRLLKLADQGKKSLDELIAEYLAMPDTTVRDGQIYRRRRRSAKQTVAETAPASTPPPPRAVAESDVDVGADDWRTARRTFEANNRVSYLNSTFFTDNVFVTDAFIFSTITLERFCRTENSFVKKTSAFTFSSTIVDGFWLRHFSVGPRADHFWRSELETNGIKVRGLDVLRLEIGHSFVGLES
jgi:hypothetical protein